MKLKDLIYDPKEWSLKEIKRLKNLVWLYYNKAKYNPNWRHMLLRQAEQDFGIDCDLKTEQMAPMYNQEGYGEYAGQGNDKEYFETQQDL